MKMSYPKLFLIGDLSTKVPEKTPEERTLSAEHKQYLLIKIVFSMLKTFGFSKGRLVF